MGNIVISEQEIRAQLQTILQAREFQASSRLKEFLRFIVEETLAGNAGQLKAYTIGITVFDRSKDFDPLHDPVVRVETAKLRNRLMEYYFSADSPGPVRIEVPKGGYIPIFSRIDKQQPEKELDYSEPSSENERQEREVRRVGTLDKITVAVLPFINLSGSSGLDDHFIDGLADEITVALTRFEDMAIISSYTTRHLDPAQEDIQSLAQKLGVRFVLHGSLQLCNNIIRIRAELADAESGSNIWADRFDASVGEHEMFIVQEKIAQRLVSRIGDSFGSIQRTLMHELSNKTEEGLGPYEAMLSYNHWMSTFDPVLFKQAKKALEQVAEKDPNNPSIVAALADIYASDYQLGYDTVPDALSKAKKYAMQAIALDGTSQTAYWALALTYFVRRNKAQLEKTVKKVVPINPANSYMLVASGLLIGLAGNVEEGLALMKRAMELNPHSPGWFRIVAYFKYYMTRDYESAANEALLINTPDCFWDPMLRAAAFGQLNSLDEAAQAVQELLVIQPDFEKNHKRFINTLAFTDDAAEHLRQGLEKAGLDLKK